MNEHELKEAVKQTDGPNILRSLDLNIGVGIYLHTEHYGTALQRFFSHILHDLKWNILFYPSEHHMRERVVMELPDVLLVETYWGHQKYTDIPYYISDFLEPLMLKRKVKGSLKPFIMIISKASSFGEIYKPGVHYDTVLGSDIDDYAFEPRNFVPTIEQLYWDFLQEHIAANK